MDKMKVGIITLHANVNYGANLQAFALCEYINEHGRQCKIIDYSQKEAKQISNLWGWLKASWDRRENRSLLQSAKLAAALILSIPEKQKKLNAFRKFRKQYCHLTDACKTEADIAKLNLDTIVCGSDQIWNPEITHGIQPVFFGDIPGVQTRISYAASIGKNELPPEQLERMLRLINRMDACSLREQQSVDYLQPNVQKPLRCVCDPVLLLDRTVYDGLARCMIKGRYVLLYSMAANQEMIRTAEEYAKDRGLPLYELVTTKARRCRHKQIAHFGPLEFLGAVRNAEAVFTNSFHGTAFSVIFEKQFFAWENKARGTRISNLLEKAGLADRVCNGTDLPPDEICYETVRKRLGEHIKESQTYLLCALQCFSDKEAVAANACFGCGACKAVCKVDAIGISASREGFWEAWIDREKCVDCGQCRMICPALNESDILPTGKLFAFKADQTLRELSASGGAAAALARVVLRDEGVAYGASQGDGLETAHFRCDTEDALENICGVKYVQSDISAVYPAIKHDLQAGKRVLFGGTPCQVDAIKRFTAAERLPTQQLLLVDLVCHGVPSPYFFKDFLAWLEGKKQKCVSAYAFRSKELSWRGGSCLVSYADGAREENDRLSSSFLNVYYSGNITRESCFSCKYAKAERVGDITLGDYWGIENTAPSFEDALGVSMVMVNTDKGMKFFSKLEGEVIPGSIDDLRQPNLYRSTERPTTRNDFWSEYWHHGIGAVLKKYGGIRTDLKSRIYNVVRGGSRR